MKEKKQKTAGDQPASYPQSSEAEMDSVAILLYLVDKKYIKASIREMDKTPNIDGYIEITDASGMPAGKIEVQVKTLAASNLKFPKYQTTKKFFAYCKISVLPVFMIVVDRKNHKAYWRFMDVNDLSAIAGKKETKSFSIVIPPENCIDGKSNAYINAWTAICNLYRYKLSDFDDIKSDNEKLREEVRLLESKLREPSSVFSGFYKEIYQFLDHYNDILDREFKAIKAIRYFNYWKIGMGIIQYTISRVSFVLYPVEYGSNKAIIREIKMDGTFDMLKAFQDGALVLIMSNDRANIAETPRRYAYQLIKPEVFRIIGKHKFSIPDLFMANEFIISFIDSFYFLLGLEKYQDRYELSKVKHYLFRILPLIIEAEHSFAQGITAYNHDLDNYMRPAAADYIQRKAIIAQNKIDQGYVPAIKISITSVYYNINLVNYYMNLLEAGGYSSAARCYRVATREMTAQASGNWDKAVISGNLRIFFSQFHRLYQHVISNHFSALHQELDFFGESDLVVYTLLLNNPDGSPISKPYLEYYRLKSDYPVAKRILYFEAKDEHCPVNRKKFLMDEDYDCVVDNIPFVTLSMGADKLDFLFDKSPTYFKINELLVSKLEVFFREKEKLDG